MERQPYIYTLPEQFILDDAVPLHWKLYTLINGFWIAGKPVFASNSWFAEKLGCTERNIQLCLAKLETMGLLERVGKSQNRTILPRGRSDTSYPHEATVRGRDEATVRHISDSNSDSNFLGAEAPRISSSSEEDDPELQISPVDDNGDPIQPRWKRKPPDNNAQAIMASVEARNNMRFPNPAKQKGLIRKMLDMRYTAEQIKNKFIELETDPFWGGKGVDFGTVISTIGQVKKQEQNSVADYRTKK